MQPLSRKDFLHNVGYGALVLPLEGVMALAPLVNPAALPPNAKPGEHYANVDEQAQALMSWYNLPGLAIGLIRENKLVYARGFGVQSIRSRKPMSEYTVLAIASISKMFTGAAVMQLIESGKVGLDDAVTRYVPYFHMTDPRYRDITVRHLLAHISGLPEWTEASFQHQLDHPWSGDDALEKLIRSLDGGLTLSQEPGRKDSTFGYSFFGYCLLGALVQEVSGIRFEEYQRRHILDPLHMFNSTFSLDEVKPQDLAGAHYQDASGNLVIRESYPYARQLGPAAYLFTNVVDLAHFIMANIGGGYYHYRILQPESQTRLWTSLYTNPYEWPVTGYNAGVFVTSYVVAGHNPLRMVLSMGAEPGVNTHITVFPDQGIAAIVLVNLNTTANGPCYSWGICDKLAIQLLYDEI